jgi:hypothetical protein
MIDLKPSMIRALSCWAHRRSASRRMAGMCGERSDGAAAFGDREPMGYTSRPCLAPAGRCLRQHGQVAQLVEQRIENPRVGGSIPPLATIPNLFTAL